jgi:hypothetical protein
LDSEAGHWSDGVQRHVTYDYGAYSNDLSTDLPSATEQCDTQIDARRAHVSIWRDANGWYMAGVHWPQLSGSGPWTLSLTVLVSAKTEAGRQELLASLWTVRFKP